jgi:DNA-binding transcriptional regulator YdaS (Cro superfamily)
MNESPLIKEINGLQPIKKAVKLVGAIALAKEMNLTRAAVYSWGRKNKIPAKHVLKLEQISGVSRHELAPEIYGVAQN